LAIEDPAGAITSRIGNYWATDDESRIINSAVGILADNIAADAGDMAFVPALIDDAAAVADAERISAANILTAEQTMGDHKTSLTTIAMHSVQHTRLRRQQLLVDNVDPVTGVVLTTYLGKRVVIDDSLPVVAGANRTIYTVVLFGEGAFSSAMGPVQTPSAMTREELVGTGGGETILSSRVNSIFHPNGFQALAGGVAAVTATYAELALAAAWDRVVDRKNVKMAFLKVND
jgi:hypothetical protein